MRGRFIGGALVLVAGCALDLSGLGGVAQDSGVSPSDGGALDGARSDGGAFDGAAILDGSADARGDDAAERDGGPPLVPACDASDLRLRVCYEFEGDLTDGSSYGNDSTTSGASYAAGVRGMALMNSSAIDVVTPHSSTYSNTFLSVDMWILPTADPPAGRTLMEKQANWGMDLYPGGELRCFFGLAGGPAVARARGNGVVAGRWNHVACTYDGTDLVAYVDGTEIGRTPDPGTISNGSNALYVGSDQGADHFDGLIDEFRVWSVGLTPAEVCAAAGTC